MTAAQLAGIWIGVMLVTVAAVAAAAWALRGRRDALTLLSFGAWCALAGVRLLVAQPPVRSTLGLSAHAAPYVIQFITYIVNVPAMLFFVNVLGTGWRHSMLGVVVVEAIFAVAAIGYESLTGHAGAADALNSWLLLAGISLGVGNFAYGYRSGRRATLLSEPVVMTGGAVFLLFVANANLGRPLFHRIDLEPIGMLAFLLALGYAVLRSAMQSQADFVSVQRELDTARKIQSSLLPRQLPSIDGIDLAVRYVPMTAVAGDIYDVVELGPSAVGVLVADVSGHGIPAALVASMVKLAFAAQRARAHDPAAVLAAMNDILCRHLEHAYVTAVYAVIDTARAEIAVASAGHPPPILQRAGQPAEPIAQAGGLILGFMPGAEYATARVAGMTSGDRLLLYTDGVLEARDRAGEFFDGHRTAGWLSSIPRSTAEAFADSALADLARWTGTSRFDDDVTFVVAEGKT